MRLDAVLCILLVALAAKPSPVLAQQTNQSSNLTVVGGDMKVVTRASAVAGGPPAAGTTPVSKPPRTVTLKGALQLQQRGPFPAPPLMLNLEAVVDTVRLVRWQYNSSKGHFFTEAQINGTWQVAVGTTTAPVPVAGTLQLVSPGWPGPGFTGSYQWSGNLTMSSNPWTLVSLPTRRREMLSAGFPVSVSGDVVVAEVTRVVVPNLLQDTMRADNLHLLDADGSVVVVGAAALPAAALVAAPAWKKAGVTASGAAPMSGYTGPAIAGIVVGSVAAGVVIPLLGVFGFRRLRRDAKQAGLQEP